MTMIDAAYEKTTSRSGKENPLGFFIAVIKERPKSGESAHKAAFKRLVLSDGYEDFVDAIVREWLSIKYSTALRAAQPPTVAEIKAVAARRKGERIAEAEMTKKAIKLIGSRLLDFMMPNGKKLRNPEMTGELALLCEGDPVADIGKSIAACGPHECRYPVARWRGEQRFCAAPTHGGSWCAEHRAVVFPPKEMEKAA